MSSPKRSSVEMTTGMPTTTGLTNSDTSVDCYTVVAHYGIDPKSSFMLSKEGMHCEPCHYFNNFPDKTEIEGRVYRICCAVQWALEQIRHDC